MLLNTMPRRNIIITAIESGVHCYLLRHPCVCKIFCMACASAYFKTYEETLRGITPGHWENYREDFLWRNTEMHHLRRNIIITVIESRVHCYLLCHPCVCKIFFMACASAYFKIYEELSSTLLVIQSHGITLLPSVPYLAKNFSRHHPILAIRRPDNT